MAAKNGNKSQRFNPGLKPNTEAQNDMADLQDLNRTIEIMFKDNDKINLAESRFGVGIDLGTTNCCMAVYRGIGVPQVIQNDMGNNKTPSYISFPYPCQDEDCSNDSEEEEEEEEEDDEGDLFFGETARDLAHDNPQGTIFDVKRMLERSFEDADLQEEMRLWPFHVVNERDQIRIKTHPISNTTHSPVEILGFLLSHLKKLAENGVATNVLNVVITVPAFFNQIQRELTREACKQAGLNVLQMINEPTAAALAYNIHKKWKTDNNKQKILRNCLIFDFGGGTLDVAILSIGNNKIQVKAVGGDPHLGGEDVDNNMVSYCIEKFKEKHSVDLRDGKMSSNAKEAAKISKRLRRLKLECEKQKKFLTQVNKIVISLDAMHGETELVVGMTREIFDEINAKLYEKCIKIVENVLEDSQIKKDDIDEVVLVGGSSRIPRVQEMVSEFFGGKHLCRSIDADEAVAVGASLLAFDAENVMEKEVHLLDLVAGPKKTIQKPSEKQRSINLVKNHSGEEKLKHWTILSKGIEVQSPPGGIDKLPQDDLYFHNAKESAFATTYYSSTMQQKIDLWEEGITPTMMRTFLPFQFTFSVLIGSRFDCGGTYKINIFLELSKEKQWKEEVLEGEQEQGKNWKKITCKINLDESDSKKLDSLRFLVINAEGQDNKYWAGQYGIKFSRFCVLLQGSNGKDIQIPVQQQQYPPTGTKVEGRKWAFWRK